MFEELKELIAEGLGISEEKIGMDSSFKNDLGADSLDLYEMIMGMEEKYDIEIPTEDLEEIVTVGDLISYIENHK